MGWCQTQLVLRNASGTRRLSPLTELPMDTKFGRWAGTFWSMEGFLERVEWRGPDLAGSRFL
jgi:hypothetical protein